MNEEKAKELLGINSDNEILCTKDGEYVDYSPCSEYVVLDGEFDIKQLEAIVWWIKNKKE